MPGGVAPLEFQVGADGRVDASVSRELQPLTLRRVAAEEKGKGRPERP